MMAFDGGKWTPVAGDVLGEVLQHETNKWELRGRFIRREEAQRHGSPRRVVGGAWRRGASSGRDVRAAELGHGRTALQHRIG
jgi:hypothetical protein